MKSLFEEAIKVAAMNALDERLDTLVTSDDLMIEIAPMWALRHACYVTCPDFDDFRVEVRVDRYGVPKKTKVIVND